MNREDKIGLILAYIGILLMTILGIVNALNETEICKETYFFILDNLDENNSLNYNLGELQEFSNSLNLKITEAEDYINNYNSLCSNFSKIPSPTINVPVLNQSYLEECNISINKKFLFGLIDFRKSLDCWKEDCGIVVGEKTCEELKNDIWLWNYEKVEDIYILKGIRVYIFITTFLIIFLFLFFRENILFSKENNFLNWLLKKIQKRKM